MYVHIEYYLQKYISGFHNNNYIVFIKILFRKVSHAETNNPVYYWVVF